LLNLKSHKIKDAQKHNCVIAKNSDDRLNVKQYQLTFKTEITDVLKFKQNYLQKYSQNTTAYSFVCLLQK